MSRNASSIKNGRFECQNECSVTCIWQFLANVSRISLIVCQHMAGNLSNLYNRTLFTQAMLSFFLSLHSTTFYHTRVIGTLFTSQNAYCYCVANRRRQKKEKRSWQFLLSKQGLNQADHPKRLKRPRRH